MMHGGVEEDEDGPHDDEEEGADDDDDEVKKIQKMKDTWYEGDDDVDFHLNLLLFLLSTHFNLRRILSRIWSIP